MPSRLDEPFAPARARHAAQGWRTRGPCGRGAPLRHGIARRDRSAAAAAPFRARDDRAASSSRAVHLDRTTPDRGRRARINDCTLHVQRTRRGSTRRRPRPRGPRNDTALVRACAHDERSHPADGGVCRRHDRACFGRALLLLRASSRGLGDDSLLGGVVPRHRVVPRPRRRDVPRRRGARSARDRRERRRASARTPSRILGGRDRNGARATHPRRIRSRRSVGDALRRSRARDDRAPGFRFAVVGQRRLVHVEAGRALLARGDRDEGARRGERAGRRSARQLGRGGASRMGGPLTGVSPRDRRFVRALSRCIAHVRAPRGLHRRSRPLDDAGLRAPLAPSDDRHAARRRRRRIDRPPLARGVHERRRARQEVDGPRLRTRASSRERLAAARRPSRRMRARLRDDPADRDAREPALPRRARGRRSPRHHQLNWKGENFYSGNHIAIFISSGAPMRSYLDGRKQRSERTVYFVTERGRVPALRSELGAVREFTEITGPSVSSEFTLVRAEL